MQKPHREVLDFLRQVGAERVHLEAGGKHMRAVFVWQGRELFFPLPNNETFTSVVAAKSDLKYLLGLVAHKKRVRSPKAYRRRRTARWQRVAPLIIDFSPDWHGCVFEHPASVAMLQGRLDLAWRAWWRDLMARQGGRSRL